MEFSRQEYWSGLQFPPPRDLPDPGIKPMSLALAGRFFTTVPPGKPSNTSITDLSTRTRWSPPCPGTFGLLFPVPHPHYLDLPVRQGALLSAEHGLPLQIKQLSFRKTLGTACQRAEGCASIPRRLPLGWILLWKHAHSGSSPRPQSINGLLSLLHWIPRHWGHHPPLKLGNGTAKWEHRSEVDHSPGCG